jgi:hypothetical protein
LTYILKQYPKLTSDRFTIITDAVHKELVYGQQMIS